MMRSRQMSPGARAGGHPFWSTSMRMRSYLQSQEMAGMLASNGVKRRPILIPKVGHDINAVVKALPPAVDRFERNLPQSTAASQFTSHHILTL